MKTENKNTSTDKKKASRKKTTNSTKDNKTVNNAEAKEIYTENKYTDESDLVRHEKKRKTGFSFFTKLVFFTAFTATIVFISLNITPILKYALQDQNSAIYPILKKYADELRIISSRLTSVTRRLNMLSVISEKNNLNNMSNVNRLVLQINEMWTTTKKYLNLIGIETIAHSNLEKEIDANSKINENGVLRDSKVEHIFPEDQFTLTNILNLDSIVQDLNIEIDNIDNEITYLENNVYDSIKASNIYSQLLERSRSSNNDYYSGSTVSDNATYPVNTIEAIVIPNKTKIRTTINEEQKNAAIIKSEPFKVQQQVSIKKKIQPPVEKTKEVTKVVNIDPPKSSPAKIVQKAKIIPSVETKLKKSPTLQSPDVKVAKIKKPKPKSIEQAVTKLIRKDQSNDLIQQNTINSADSEKKYQPNSIIDATSFDSPSLLDDVSLDFSSKIDDYGEIEILNKENNKSIIEEDDDYTGG